MMRVPVTAALLAGAVAVALHAAAWGAAAGVVAKSVHPPPLQSALALGGSALLLRVVNVASHRRRMVAIGAILVAFGIAMVLYRSICNSPATDSWATASNTR